MKTFAERLKEKAKEKGMKQEELSEKLGVSRCMVPNWMTGRNKPMLGKIEKLAEVLECTVEFLLYGKEEKEVETVEENHNDILRNGSGYIDPVAYMAMKNLERNPKKMELKQGEIWEVKYGNDLCCAVVVRAQEGFCNVLLLKEENERPEQTVTVIAKGVKYTDPSMLSYKMNNGFVNYVRTMKDVDFERLLQKVKERLGFESTDNGMLKAQVDSLLDCQLQEENERLKKELEDNNRLIDSLKCENQILGIQKETMAAASGQADEIRIELAKVQAERDLYKQFYEQMFERVIAK